ncbi:uncharacterized protein LOC115928608 isoform X2 [Strongylocentrotus purpuratus]|uniref:Uncharacterized protein n=1 Tax=Strongylocentrotus purpuratus TaxID=7668 RepID=A0A7M7PHC4_STRPU|nr:uncharacterized protein LOC115928608 isoform X2 [Strongylocentrotus purpuratus]
MTPATPPPPTSDGQPENVKFTHSSCTTTERELLGRARKRMKFTSSEVEAISELFQTFLEEKKVPTLLQAKETMDENPELSKILTLRTPKDVIDKIKNKIKEKK